MRRPHPLAWILLGVGVAGAVIAASLRGPPAPRTVLQRPPPPPPLPSVPPGDARTAAVRSPAPPPPPPTVAPAPEPAIEAAVTEGCGLSVAAGCRGGDCAAVHRVPDLDHLGGWMRLLTAEPGFVLHTLGRDAGLGGGSCAATVAQAFPHGAHMVRGPDGGELWCGMTSPEAGPLCDELVRQRLGLRDAPPFATSTRQLRFDR